MNLFDCLYLHKDEPRFVSGHLSRYLMAEIYSPAVVRLASERWSELPPWVQDSVHPIFQNIILNKIPASDKNLYMQLNQLLVDRATRVLAAYRDCSVPLTDDPTVPSCRCNLLSQRGELALCSLRNALIKGDFSIETVSLAIRSSHKFLMDMSFYRDFPGADFKGVDILAFQSAQEGKPVCLFPTLQLTKGCMNGCAHCEVCAEPHLSHMPYPMFRRLWQRLDGIYKYYETQSGAVHYFDRYYFDSDSSSYFDPIIGADSGDVAWMIKENKGLFFFMTKGITDRLSVRSIAKGAMFASQFHLSFVDIPTERHNVAQVQKTIRLIQSLPTNPKIMIEHTHLANGPSVSDSIFLGIPSIKRIIHRTGRAIDNFSARELRKDDNLRICAIRILPNGDIVWDRNIGSRRHGNIYQTDILGSFIRKIDRQSLMKSNSLPIWKKIGRWYDKWADRIRH
ncbi:MAG: hypothetical protein IJV07_05895 [Alphaproteobacteria bacterium]|nr:hypothetical protein [Alphaproteobacteria bacterium]